MLIKVDYYLCNDVVFLAKDLLGKYVFTWIDDKLCGGQITETEAYAGIDDKASHAYGGLRSRRTEIMYARGGVAYVYLCYGIHSMFNIVTNQEDIPDAVLIRAIRPQYGIGCMLERSGHKLLSVALTNGPGKVARALGIHYHHSGIKLTDNCTAAGTPGIWLEDRGERIPEDAITVTTRIGVDYAGEDALMPYRFVWNFEG